jgi:hypothetical protein
MPWTTPHVFVANDILTAAQLNEMQDNLIFLHEEAIKITDSAVVDSDISTSSASFADMAGFSVSATTSGGVILIELLPAPVNNANTGILLFSGGSYLWMAALVGAVVLPPVALSAGAAAYSPPAGARWTYQPAAGTYTVKLQWASGSGTSEMQFGTGGGAILRVTEYVGT